MVGLKFESGVEAGILSKQNTRRMCRITFNDGIGPGKIRRNFWTSEIFYRLVEIVALLWSKQEGAKCHIYIMLRIIFYNKPIVECFAHS